VSDLDFESPARIASAIKRESTDLRLIELREARDAAELRYVVACRLLDKAQAEEDNAGDGILCDTLDRVRALGPVLAVERALAADYCDNDECRNCGTCMVTQACRVRA
jgi:hypothetical protein